MTMLPVMMNTHRHPLAALLLRRVRPGGIGWPSGGVHITGRRHRKKKPRSTTCTAWSP